MLVFKKINIVNIDCSDIELIDSINDIELNKIKHIITIDKTIHGIKIA